jgi:hypothetical protein
MVKEYKEVEEEERRCERGRKGDKEEGLQNKKKMLSLFWSRNCCFEGSGY